MKFNLNFLTFRKLYIYFCFLALLNIFFSTSNVNAKSFSINDIEISTPFEINFNKSQIIDEGFLEAFNELVLSIVQTKDQKKKAKKSFLILGDLGQYQVFQIMLNSQKLLPVRMELVLKLKLLTL